MQRFIIASVLSGLCGFTAVYVSAGLRFAHHDESVYREMALWEGKPFLYDGQLVYHPEHQNRVLFPAALVTVSRIGLLSTSEWYLILRLVIAYLAFLSFFYAINVNYNLAAVGMLVLLLTLLFAFNHVMEHAADFFGRAVHVAVSLGGNKKTLPMDDRLHSSSLFQSGVGGICRGTLVVHVGHKAKL